jgi:hypothetical protein
VISEPVCYCVDEAGDPTIWGRRGRLLIGSEGCSNYLILGSVMIGNLALVSQSLEALRNELLSDSYFKKVPSMQPENRKTAVWMWPKFHCVWDCDDAREEDGLLYNAKRPLNAAILAERPANIGSPA